MCVHGPFFTLIINVPRFHISHLILSGRGAYPHDTGPTAAVPSDADVDHIGVATRATAEGTGGGVESDLNHLNHLYHV